MNTPLNGITTNAKSLQAQLHYKFDNGITVDNNARYTSMRGGFSSNFLSVAPLSGLIGSTKNGGVVARAVYAAGPNKGKDVAEARARAYAAVEKISWKNSFYRRDIGWRALKR